MESLRLLLIYCIIVVFTSGYLLGPLPQKDSGNDATPRFQKIREGGITSSSTATMYMEPRVKNTTHDVDNIEMPTKAAHYSCDLNYRNSTEENRIGFTSSTRRTRILVGASGTSNQPVKQRSALTCAAYTWGFMNGTKCWVDLTKRNTAEFENFTASLGDRVKEATLSVITQVGEFIENSGKALNDYIWKPLLAAIEDPFSVFQYLIESIDFITQPIKDACRNGLDFGSGISETYGHMLDPEMITALLYEARECIGLEVGKLWRRSAKPTLAQMCYHLIPGYMRTLKAVFLLAVIVAAMFFYKGNRTRRGRPRVGGPSYEALLVTQLKRENSLHSQQLRVASLTLQLQRERARIRELREDLAKAKQAHEEFSKRQREKDQSLYQLQELELDLERQIKREKERRVKVKKESDKAIDQERYLKYRLNRKWESEGRRFKAWETSFVGKIEQERNRALGLFREKIQLQNAVASHNASISDQATYDSPSDQREYQQSPSNEAAEASSSEESFASATSTVDASGHDQPTNVKGQTEIKHGAPKVNENTGRKSSSIKERYAVRSHYLLPVGSYVPLSKLEYIRMKMMEVKLDPTDERVNGTYDVILSNFAPVMMKNLAPTVPDNELPPPEIYPEDKTWLRILPAQPDAPKTPEQQKADENEVRFHLQLMDAKDVIAKNHPKMPEELIRLQAHMRVWRLNTSVSKLVLNVVKKARGCPPKSKEAFVIPPHWVQRRRNRHGFLVYDRMFTPVFNAAWYILTNYDWLGLFF